MVRSPFWGGAEHAVMGFRSGGGGPVRIARLTLLPAWPSDSGQLIATLLAAMVACFTLLAGRFCTLPRSEPGPIGSAVTRAGRIGVLRCAVPALPGNGPRISRCSRHLSTSAEEETRMTTDLYLDSNCAQCGGRTCRSRASADVARDLDGLRQGQCTTRRRRTRSRSCWPLLRPRPICGRSAPGSSRSGTLRPAYITKRESRTARTWSRGFWQLPARTAAG
jgi:hypothetical protein